MSRLHAPSISEDSFDHESGIALVERHASDQGQSKEPRSSYHDVTDPSILTADQENHAPIHDWPTYSGELRKSRWDHAQEIFCHVFTLLIPLPMLVLAGWAAHKNGKPVDDREWKNYQKASNAAVTIFPILFAGVVGRTVRAGASWKLERRIKLGHMEQLMGSQTIAGTVTTHFILRSFNLVGLGLFILWLLSPVGGQSSLHLLSIKSQPRTSLHPMKYLDTNTTTATSNFNEGADFQWVIPALDTLYNSALSAPEATKISSTDLWGNVKIPSLSRLQGLHAANATGWTDVPGENVFYSSLLGIPLLDIPPTGIANFSIETSYWDLDCFNITKAPPINVSSSYDPKGPRFNNSFNGPSGGKYFPLQLAVDRFLTGHAGYGTYGGLAQTIGDQSIDLTPQTLLFQSYTFEDDDQSNVAYCSIRQAYVEAAVTCADSNKTCNVSSMRDSQLPHPDKTLNPLLYYGCFSNFANSLYNASARPHPGTSTLSELYMIEPERPFAHSNNAEDYMILYTLPKATFEERLGHLLNTYYIGSLAPESFLGAFTVSATAANLTTIATVIDTRRVYVSSIGWLFLFIACTLAMLAAAIIGVVLVHNTLNPDILGYCSSLTRDSPYIQLPSGGNTLGGAARARLLSSLEVRLGDVGTEDGAGHIALAPVGQAARVARGKLYI